MVQELIDDYERPPYTPMVFIIHPTDHSNKRSAISCDIDPIEAPELKVYFHVSDFNNHFSPTNLRYKRISEHRYLLLWDPVEDGNLKGYQLLTQQEPVIDSLIMENAIEIDINPNEYPVNFQLRALNHFGRYSALSNTLTIEYLPLSTDTSTKSNVFLAPNPVAGHCRIYGDTPVDEIVIIDMMGNQSKRLVQSSKVDIKGIPTGIHQVIFYDKNKRVGTQKIIKY
ncbi:T9SS type A sorting domain-containing protein [Persicobacter diffluens]